MDSFEETPAEETVTSRLDFDPSGSSSSLDLAGSFPADAPAQDPMWIEELQILTDPFSGTLTTIPDDEPNQLQAEFLCQNTLTMPEHVKLDQVGQLEHMAPAHAEHLEILGLDQVEQLVTLEQNKDVNLDLVEQPEAVPLEQPEAFEDDHAKKSITLEVEATIPLDSSGPAICLHVESVAGIPGNMELEDSSKDDVSEAMAFPVEFEKYFRVVQENPEDFTGWTYLLQHVEEENHIGAARKAFDSFFSRYPYCYGYWKKYADMEKKLSGIHMADEVYRRGLQAVPLSVDLWLHYIEFVRETAVGAEAESHVRVVFEHAVLSAGLDFRSDSLWDAYIAWEMDLGNLANVTALYDRILAIPTQLYSLHHQRFRDHVQNNLPKHFLSLEEFSKLRKELASSTLNGAVSHSEDLPSGTEDLADPAKRVTEIENMRHKVLESRQEIFNHNENEVAKRWTFEEGIKRPYFHVKPLERAELGTWREYLAFEMESGFPERVVILFERCLVACALYEEFWIKYAKYMENYSIDGVRQVYKSACLTHLPKKPTVHLLWAMFEEQQGNVAEARRILKALEDVLPTLAVVRLRHVNLERRQGDMEKAESLLQDSMKNAGTTNESTFYAIKLARHLFKVQNNLLKARSVLLDAIERDKTSPKLYLNLLELEYSGDVQKNEEQILACFDRALRSPLPIETRITFSQRKIEFLEDFGSNVNMLVSSYEAHEKLLEVHKSTKVTENGSQELELKQECTEDVDMNFEHMTPTMQANHTSYSYSWYQHYSYQNAWAYGQYYPPPSV